jgi:tRNA A37 methylthiotransferase MiaB
LRELSRAKRKDFASRYLGREVDVLFEQKEPEGWWTGLTANYLRVGVVSAEPLRNRFAPVVVTEAGDEMAFGVLPQRLSRNGVDAFAGPGRPENGLWGPIERTCPDST